MISQTSRVAFSFHRAFAIADAVCLAGMVGLVGLVAAVQIDKEEFARVQLKDATQTRGIHQAFVLWGQTNRDMYPLPSLHDSQNQTVNTDLPASKDTTANIYSILLYNSFPRA